MRKVLVIGYGNPARRDDGLGPAFAEAVEALGLPGVAVASDYQLNIEDAAEVARHDAVVFADASLTDPAPCRMRRVGPGEEGSFTSHSVEPEAVMALAQRLFGARTQGYVLGIRGYDFDGFGERLSEGARRNLAAAVAFFRRALDAPSLDVAAEGETPLRQT